MYKLCKSEQAALRQRELERHLLAMMKTTRFEDISVSDLCIQTGVSRKAFYRYFSGKEGALYALIDHTLWELESFPFEGNQLDMNAYRKKILWFLQFWQDKKPLLTALDNSGINEILIKRMIVYAMSGSGAMQYLIPYFAPEVQEYALTFGISGLMSMIFIWHRSGYQQTPEQMAEIAFTLLTKPLFSDKRM